MLPSLLTYTPLTISLISQSDIVTILIIVVIFFSILLVLGVRKSYMLKKENDQLDKMSEELAKQEEKYKDFTEGHIMVLIIGIRAKRILYVDEHVQSIENEITIFDDNFKIIQKLDSVYDFKLGSGHLYE